MLDAEEVFAEALDRVLASLEGLDFGDVSQFAPSTTIFVVLNMLVRVHNLDHLFFGLVIEQVVLDGGAGCQRVKVRQRESFTEIVL